jgi:hypothetical protein
MDILALVIAIVVLIGLGVTWSSLRRVGQRIRHLEHIHASSTAREIVKLKGEDVLSLLERSGGEATLPFAPVFERLVILGFDRKVIYFENQPNGSGVVFKNATVEIPQGTTQVVPMLVGFGAWFGQVTVVSEDQFSPSFVDHHLGFEYVSVGVQEVSRVTATLAISALLRDINGDDPWSGVVVVRLLFLGPQ